MKKLNRLLALVLVVGLVLTAAHLISAQQRDGMQRQGRQQRGQFDPARMIERRMENIMQGIQEMGVPDNEAAILKTQIESLLRMRMDPNREVAQAMDQLQKAIDSKDDAEIKAKLDIVKAKRKEQKAKDEEMEKNLLEILPLEVEAYLTVQGIVNGGGGVGMGFGGARGQGRQGAGGQGMQRRPGG